MFSARLKKHWFSSPTLEIGILNVFGDARMSTSDPYRWYSFKIQLLHNKTAVVEWTNFKNLGDINAKAEMREAIFKALPSTVNTALFIESDGTQTTVLKRQPEVVLVAA